MPKKKDIHVKMTENSVEKLDFLVVELRRRKRTTGLTRTETIIKMIDIMHAQAMKTLEEELN